MHMIPTSALRVDFDEPRVLDTDLAEWLAFKHPRQIRELIARNLHELADYGSLSCRATNPGKLGGRPSQAYYLNEGQALVLCALARTGKAAEVRKALIDLFMAYRQGKVVEVRAHRRRPPSARGRDAYETAYMRNRGVLLAFAHDPDALLDLLAGTLARVEMLEARH